MLRYINFPYACDLEWEGKRLNIVRILLGVILLWRQSFLLWTTTLSSENIQSTFLAADCIQLVAILCFTLGFFTPLSCIFLSTTYAYYSIQNHTYNLGPMIALTMIIAMFFLQTGKLYSLDAKILKFKKNWFSSSLFWIYSLIRAPTLKEYSQARIILLLTYAYISFEAVLEHLVDPYWTNGITITYLVANSYWSSFYNLFQWIFANYPKILSAFSISSIILQTIFQLGMIPFLFFRIGTWFVILYGFLFFLFCAVGINISILPLVELLLWYCVFFNQPLLPKLQDLTYVLATEKQQRISPIKIYSTAYLCFFAISFYQLISFKFFSVPRSQLIIEGSKYVGLWPPVVFNSVDLQSGNQWAVIYRKKEEDKERELVPLNAEDGSRLWYHLSDTIYYRTLQWRRGLIGRNDIAELHKQESPYSSILREVVLIDYAFNRFKNPINYEIEIYQNYTANADFSGSIEKRYKPNKIFTYTLTIP
jgi:hypothetical protein